MSTFSTVFEQVEALYIGYFQRPGDPEAPVDGQAQGFQYWVNQLENNTLTWSQEAASFSVQLESVDDYPYLLSGPSGVNETVTSPNGWSLSVDTNIYNFINSVYEDLFNRSVLADTTGAGLAYWSSQLKANAGNAEAVGNFILNVISGAATGSSDDLTLQAKVQLAGYITTYVSENDLTWNTAIGNEAKILIAATNGSNLSTEETAWTTYVTSSAPTTFTLTTGIDAPGTGAFTSGSITGNNNLIYGTFNGTGATYNAGDNITGPVGSTGNKLTLSDLAGAAETSSSNATTVAATVANISNLTILSGQSVDANTVTSPAGFTGLTQLSVTSVSTGAADTITVAATTSVTVADSGAAGVTVHGGLNIAVTESGAGSVAVGGGTTSTDPVGTVSVTLSGTGAGSATVQAGTAVAVTTSETGGVSIGSAVAPSGAVTVTDTGGGAIAVDGGASATIAVTTAAGAATATVAVTGVTGVSTVTESAVNSNSGAITGWNIGINGGTGATATTTGGGFVTLGGTAASTVTTPVAGNATITDTFAGSALGTYENEDALAAYAAGVVSITTTADKGAITVGTTTPAQDPTGNVTIVNETVAGSHTYYGSSTTDIYTNGSTSVSVTGGGGGVITDEAATNTVAAVTLIGSNGTTAITSNALTSLTVNNSLTGAATTANVSNATSGAQTLALAISGDSSSSSTVSDNTATTFNVTATGTSNDIVLADSQTAVKTTYSFTNNGSGTLTLESITDNAGKGEVITVTAGAVALGNLSGDTHLASVTDSGSGAVSVEIDAQDTSFSGGSSSGDVVWLLDEGAGSVNFNVTGGTGGNNTLILNGVTTDYSTGIGTSISGFQNLQLNAGATGSYSAANFTGLIDNATTAAVDFTNVAAGTPLTIIGSPTNTLTVSLASTSGTSNTLPITIGSGSGAALTATVTEANNQTLAITSVTEKDGTAAQTLTIADATTAGQANPATAITVAGSGGLTLSYSVTNGATDSVASINASSSSGAVNTDAVVGAAAGLTITGGSGALTAAGSGAGTGETVSNAVLASTDSFTTGSGGATIYVGYGGAGTGAGTAESVNLAASTAKSDAIVLGDAAAGGGGYGQRVTISSFTLSASSAADVLKFSSATTGATYSAATDSLLTTNATSLSTAAYGGTDSFTVSNGMIVYSGGDSVAQEIINTTGILDAAGTDFLTAFVAGGNTYVIASGDTANGQHIIEAILTSDTATEIGAANAALNSVSIGSSVTYTGATATSIAETANNTVNDTGYIVQGITGATAGTFTETVNNLAQSAIINDSSTGTFNITTTQVGTAGSNSLQLNMSGAQTITTATFTGDNLLVLDPTAASTITTLVDPGSTLASISIKGSATLGIGAITDTALTSIAISDSAAVTLASSTTPLTQNGLTVTLGSTSSTIAAADVIYTSGTGDHLTATGDTGTPTLSATGANAVILGGSGAETIIAGSGATVTMLQGVAAAQGVASVTGNAAINSITVGLNSTVTLGTTAGGVASDDGSTIVVAGDVTGATSSGAYALTTVNNAVDDKTILEFFTAGTEVAPTFVNVASATSLAAALNIAASAESGSTSGDHYYDAFTYGGNTYVLEHTGTGTAVTAMGTTDILVEITGLMNLTNLATSGHGVIL